MEERAEGRGTHLPAGIQGSWQPRWWSPGICGWALWKCPLLDHLEGETPKSSSPGVRLWTGLLNQDESQGDSGVPGVLLVAEGAI